MNPEYLVSDIIRENIKEAINKIGLFWHRGFYEESTDFYNEFYKGFLKVLGGEEYKNTGPLVAFAPDRYKYKAFYVPKCDYLQNDDMLSSTYKFINNLHVIIEYLESTIKNIKSYYSLFKMPLIVKHILHETIMHWLRLDAKDIQGNGRVIINTSHRRES